MLDAWCFVPFNIGCTSPPPLFQPRFIYRVLTCFNHPRWFRIFFNFLPSTSDSMWQEGMLINLCERYRCQPCSTCSCGGAKMPADLLTNIHLSIYPSTCLSTYLPIYLYTYLSIYLPIYLSTYLPIYLSTYLSTYLSIYVSIYLSMTSNIYTRTHTYIYIYIHIYIYVYI